MKTFVYSLTAYFISLFDIQIFIFITVRKLMVTSVIKPENTKKYYMHLLQFMVAFQRTYIVVNNVVRD